jgi:hypothetical protein
MNRKVIQALRIVARKFGVDISRYRPGDFIIPIDIGKDTTDIIRRVQPFTMSSPERINALCEAVKYIALHQIPGDIVECGVWKGGSVMAAAAVLLRFNDINRNLYLFDTFEGMPDPTEKDITNEGVSAETLMQKSRKYDSSANSVWCYASLHEVRQAVNSTGYEPKKVHYVKGKVEETIPLHAPSKIALLRIDTDWYESTRHELIHLFPRITHGGVIIIDDYGHWRGARQAVDDFLREHEVQLLLNRIDYTGRIGVVFKAEIS